MHECKICGADLLFIYFLKPHDKWVCTDPDCNFTCNSTDLKGE